MANKWHYLQVERISDKIIKQQGAIKNSKRRVRNCLANFTPLLTCVWAPDSTTHASLIFQIRSTQQATRPALFNRVQHFFRFLKKRQGRFQRSPFSSESAWWWALPQRWNKVGYSGQGRVEQAPGSTEPRQGLTRTQLSLFGSELRWEAKLRRLPHKQASRGTHYGSSLIMFYTLPPLELCCGNQTNVHFFAM